jgi:hypothetical protein
LIENLQEYFPDNVSQHDWVRNPFDIEQNLPDIFQPIWREQLIELSCDSGLKDEFKTESLPDFWLKRRDEYVQLSDEALKMLMPFSTTYLCEAAFSSMVTIKNKYRTRLNMLEPDLRLKLTKIVPDIARLCSDKQAHSSH